jgi:hypothetical protein
VRALERALAIDPAHIGARFHLAALRHDEAALRSLPSECRFMVDSYRFAAMHPMATHFADTFDTLRFALARARPDGSCVELGVRRGTTIRFLATLCDEVHGFDAFEGLPEAWGDEPAGLYSTGGRLPDVPANVTLHVGWFAEILPAWRDQGPLRFVNVDCDIYRSTSEALAALAPRIGAGTVLCFDEYSCNPGWEAHEHRAWTEAAARHGWDHAYVAFSLFTKQAVVQIR